MQFEMNESRDKIIHNGFQSYDIVRNDISQIQIVDENNIDELSIEPSSSIGTYEEIKTEIIPLKNKGKMKLRLEF